MDSSYKFKQNHPVYFDNGVMKGGGVIVGCSTIAMPVIGKTYLVKVTDNSLPTSEYPFDTMAIAECHLSEVSRVEHLVSV